MKNKDYYAIIGRSSLSYLRSIKRNVPFKSVSYTEFCMADLIISNDFEIIKDRYDNRYFLNDANDAESLIKNRCLYFGISYNPPNINNLSKINNHLCACGKECKPTDNGECYDCWNKKHLARFL